MNVNKVVSFRIPKELKDKMKKIDTNWSEEIRKFIEAKVREHIRKEKLEEIDEMLKHLPTTERGTAAKYVREDRDSR
jgi:predicted DNA-binding protein